MKWARVKPSGESEENPFIQMDDAGCYKDFAKEEHIKKVFEHQSHQWVHHEFSFPFGSKEKYLHFQKRYEVFCGGYLYFYDEKTRNGAVDHAIYFKWSPYYKNNGTYTVTIYLTPAPAKKKIKYSRYKTNAQELMMEDSLQQNGNKDQVQVMQQLKTTTAMADETTSDMSIDPPPPPPPPPPSMQDDK